MMNEIALIFSYQFMQRALVVGLLVSLCAAVLGVSLVLKRYSMIGDGLSHVGFGSLAVAMVLNLAPLAVTIPVVVLAAFWLLQLSERNQLKGDSVVAVLSTAALAIGVMVLSLSGGMTSDVNSYLFGSVLAMSASDATLSIIMACVVLVLFALFYRPIFAITFDETFARATGKKTRLFNMLLAALTAVTIVLGMRIMGAMLISSLVIFPALSAMCLCKSYKGVTVCAAVLSLCGYFLGLCLSYWLSTPTGATVVVIHLAVYLLCLLIRKIRCLV